jgi:multiple sugar transport system permease protein
MAVIYDPVFGIASLNTFVYVAASVSAQFAIGLGLALLFNMEFRGRRIFWTLALFPMMMAPVAVGLEWKWLYNPNYGPINYLLETVGIPGPGWLSEPSLSLLSIMIVDTWLCTPFVTLLLLAGLQSIPAELYESARVDGATVLHSFRHVTLPLLRAVILVVLVIRTMDALQIFDLVFVLTGGGPGYSSETLVLYGYRTAFRFLEIGDASAFACIMLLIIFSFSMVYVRLIRPRIEY